MMGQLFILHVMPVSVNNEDTTPMFFINPREGGLKLTMMFSLLPGAE